MTEHTKTTTDQPLPAPDYACPFCGETLWDDETEWLGGLPDATRVPGEGEIYASHHCPICETAVVRHV